METRFRAWISFSFWSILIPGVFRNIPYAMVQFIAKKVVSSHAGSPIWGVCYSTCKVLWNFGSEHDRTLTFIPSHHLTILNLETIRVVVDVGGGYVIPADVPKLPIGRVDESRRNPQPRQNRRRSCTNPRVATSCWSTICILLSCTTFQETGWTWFIYRWYTVSWLMGW